VGADDYVSRSCDFPKKEIFDDFFFDLEKHFFPKRKFPFLERLTKFGNDFQKRKYFGRVILVKFLKKEILMAYVSRSHDPPSGL